MEKLTVSQVQMDYTDFNDEKVVTVTEWYNGEGFDVTISAKFANTNFSLTNADWDNLKECMEALCE